MLTINPKKEDPMDPPFSSFIGPDDLHIEKIDLTVDIKEENLQTTAQMSSNDENLYKSCPVWEELIFVRCQYCKCSILPHSIQKHIEMRHTGEVQYEKDPEFHIFRKKPPKPKPTLPLPTTPKPRASPSSTTGVFEVPGPYSRIPAAASCSGDVSTHASQSPRLAEQYLGWPNSPHGAIQMSPSVNIVRVKPENKAKAATPAGKVLASRKTKTVQELLPLSPVEKDEPYNQTFSFSAAGPLPSTSSFSMPSTSSQDVPSTSYEMPSTSSSYVGGLLPCQPLEASLSCSPVFQPSSSVSSAAASSSGTQEKAPAVEKLVLRRVLQTDQKAPAERSQSHQGLKGVTKNKKDSSQTYFMVVKSKDRQQNLISARQQIRKETNVVNQEKDKVEQKMKKLENHRTKLINKLFQELQNVKLKLDQCNRSKQQIENKLLEVKADLEETKRTTDFQNEALLKQNEKFETEIQMLKQRNEELTNSLEQAQIYRLGNHAWDFGDSHMSKQFQAIEEQKLELQRRIEELECESRELKNSSTIERGRFDAKLRQYFKIISELKKRLDAQTARSAELQIQRDFYEKHLPPEICFQVKSQLAAFQHPNEVYEVFPGVLTPQPTPPITSPAIPLAETLLSEIQSNYIFQSQMSPESPDVFQQQQTSEMAGDEEVS